MNQHLQPIDSLAAELSLAADQAERLAVAMSDAITLRTLRELLTDAITLRELLTEPRPEKPKRKELRRRS